ncbi:FUSC family protein [Microbacterium sp. NPDC006705]|uniref:FUSC family protein n=1 Tax=unclassified Microbacterium TaxID=2609290 RepID=UPI00249F1248|nr:FUSC family protein [Microbacterium sp. BDGP8]WHE36501.1 FUSC family protein [Microbacterium sp. BDGP8]
MSRRVWRQLFALRPAPRQWPAALQAALAVAVPPLLGLVIGEPRWGSVGSLGALIVLHLPDRSRRERAVALPIIAGALLVAACVGAALGTALIPGLVAMSVIAVGGSFLAQALAVGPPGALFLVLITGSAGQLVAPAAAGGAGMSCLEVVASLAGGALLGYLIVVLPLLAPTIRARDRMIFAQRTPWRFAVPASARLIVARIAASAVLAVPVSATLGLHHAAWVMLACLGILQKDADVYSAVLRGTQRLIGTGLAILLVIVLAAIEPRGWERIAWAAGLIFLFELLLRRNLTWALAVVTPMAVLLASTAGQPISEVAAERVVDTIAGAGIAGVVLLAAVTGERRRSTTGSTHVG